MAKPLGANQRAVLRCLVEQGIWKDDIRARWHWITVSQTTRILESLAKRGLAFLRADGWYEVTDEGRSLDAYLRNPP